MAGSFLLVSRRCLILLFLGSPPSATSAFHLPTAQRPGAAVVATPRLSPGARRSSFALQLALGDNGDDGAVDDGVDPPIRRVAVVGAGIAGLALAHALENGQGGDDVRVDVYDSRPSLDFEAGAGIQLSGGMSVLGDINPSLREAVERAALPLTHIRSRAKPWGAGDAGGGGGGGEGPDNDSFSTLLEMDLREAVRKEGGEAEERLIVDGKLMFYTIMRGALQEVLMDELPPQVSRRVRFGMTLSGIEASAATPDAHEGDAGIMCRFENGKVEGPFDLVVGCDGIKSAVKEYVDTGTVTSGRDGGDEGRSSVYSGIRIQYAVANGDPGEESQPSTAELRQYFGDGAYALTGTYGAGENRPPCRGAFLIFRDEDYIGPFKKRRNEGAHEEGMKGDGEGGQRPVRENADWTQDNRSKGDARAECTARVLRSNLPSVEVEPIIERSDRFFELGVYFHNPFSLTGWTREVPGSGGRYCVLAGDAAHAMPPFLGQGGNQAIQDAFALASKIFVHNANVMGERGDARVLPAGSSSPSVSGEEVGDGTPPLKSLLKEYERQRWATTTSISVKAGLLGYLETGGEGFVSMFRDVFFRTMGLIGVARKVMLDGATPKV